MNRIVFNYPCNVLPTPKSMQRVVDGRTFFAEIDLGFWLSRRSRVQLIGVDLPEVRQGQAGVSPDDAVKFERAKQCLTLALYGAVEATDSTVAPIGRRILIAPLRPNEHGRIVARAYLQVARNNVMYSHLVHSVAGFNFIDVNAFINFCGNYGWDLAKAKEILDTFQVMDSTLG